MANIFTLLRGAAIGAVVMYYMDPDSGRSRQARVRNQVYRWQGEIDDALNTSAHDLRHRARGVMSQGLARFDDTIAPDQVLEARLRSRLGFLTRHPGGISVAVQDGQAILSGDVLETEAAGLLKGLGKVRGMRAIQNNLRVHAEAGDIQSLQGEGMPPANSSQWAPSSRLLAVSSATYLFFFGMLRGGFFGTLAQLGAVTLGVRALSNKNMRQIIKLAPKAASGAVQVRKNLQINVPVKEVYSLWSNFENFPKFMENIESIQNTSADQSHWVVKGPAGSKVEFDAIMTRNEPENSIAWETTPESQIKHSGQVRFRPAGQQGTQVNVQMAYTPPAGVAGAVVAALFGKDAKSEMDTDLMRMKSLLEKGHTSVDNKQVKQQDVMPVTGQNGPSHKKGGRPRSSGKADDTQSDRQTNSTDGETSINQPVDRSEADNAAEE